MRMFGPLNERRIEPVISCVKEYEIDGAVNLNHLGWRQISPTFKIYKDVLDSLNVPILNIDCDLIDSTITSADEVRQKIEQFFELLEDQ